MQKGLILFSFFIFFSVTFSHAEQINFDNFNFLNLIKNIKNFNITYSYKIIPRTGLEYSARSTVNVSGEKNFYLKNENLVGGGFLELKVNEKNVIVKKIAFKNDISQENLVETNKHFYNLRDKTIIEWISFHKKYLKYLNFEEDYTGNDKEIVVYKIKKLNPTNLSGNSDSNKVLKVEGALSFNSNLKIPKEYYFKIFFENGIEVIFSIQVTFN